MISFGFNDCFSELGPLPPFSVARKWEVTAVNVRGRLGVGQVLGTQAQQEGQLPDQPLPTCAEGWEALAASGPRSLRAVSLRFLPETRFRGKASSLSPRLPGGVPSASPRPESWPRALGFSELSGPCSPCSPEPPRGGGGRGKSPLCPRPCGLLSHQALSTKSGARASDAEQGGVLLSAHLPTCPPARCAREKPGVPVGSWEFSPPKETFAISPPSLLPAR